MSPSLLLSIQLLFLNPSLPCYLEGIFIPRSLFGKGSTMPVALDLASVQAPSQHICGLQLLGCIQQMFSDSYFVPP